MYGQIVIRFLMQTKRKRPSHVRTSTYTHTNTPTLWYNTKKRRLWRRRRRRYLLQWRTHSTQPKRHKIYRKEWTRIECHSVAWKSFGHVYALQERNVIFSFIQIQTKCNACDERTGENRPTDSKLCGGIQAFSILCAHYSKDRYSRYL